MTDKIHKSTERTRFNCANYRNPDKCDPRIAKDFWSWSKQKADKMCSKCPNFEPKTHNQGKLRGQ